MTEEEFEELKQQAELGDANAMLRVGIQLYLSQSNDIAENRKQAMILFEKAANANDFDAMYFLGWSLKNVVTRLC